MSYEPKPEFASNRGGETVAEALAGFISHAATGFVGGSRLDIASAYFNVGGYSLLADSLDQLNHTRILLGAEPTPPEKRPRVLGEESARPERAARARISRALEGHERDLTTDRNLLGFTVEADATMKRLVGWLRSGKAEVRRLEKRFLHGKAFLISDRSHGVVAGSSNFTYAGLATNLELNLGNYVPHVVGRVQEWFEELWEEAVDYDLAALFEGRFESNSPQLIYLRMLWQLYGADLAAEAEAEGAPQIHLTAFQTDGLWRARRILDRHNGVLIADEVGLGKTFLAGELIREAAIDRRQRVLVITPATLRDGPWRAFRAEYNLPMELVSYEEMAGDSRLNPDRGPNSAPERSPDSESNSDRAPNPVGGRNTSPRSRADSESNSDRAPNPGLRRNPARERNPDSGPTPERRPPPGRARRFTLDADIGQYAMVVIDEAQNLRNPSTQRAEALRRLLAGSPPKKLVLLSATPVNNSLWDLYYLLGYFLRNDATFADVGIRSMRDHFATAMAQNPGDLSPEHLFDILDAVAVRRTRSFVKQFYPNDTIRVGGQEEPITFPTPRVRKVSYDLDAVLPGFFDRIAAALDPDAGPEDPNALTLARYAPSQYRLDEDAETYEAQLTGLLRSGLLKRFESSPYAFSRTCGRMADSHDAFLTVLDAGRVASGEALADWIAGDSDDLDSELDKYFEAQAGPVETTDGYDVARLRRHAERDRNLLRSLADEAASVGRAADPTLAELVEQLAAIAAEAEATGIGAGDIRDKRKVLIFSYYADTVDWIFEHLEEVTATDERLAAYRGRIASLSGSTAAASRREVIWGFAPRTTDAPGRGGRGRRGGSAPVGGSGDDGHSGSEPSESVDARAGNHGNDGGGGGSPATDGSEHSGSGAADRFDLLVTTDVLAEGVNLQQARHIVNYDLPWNPMRLVQRHGRIDRIGSTHAEVFIRCVFPDARLDDLLGLEERLHRKITQAAASIGVGRVLPDRAGRDVSFTETREEIERIRREDAALFERGGTARSVLSGEEYRQELRRAAEQGFREQLEALPWGAGSGMAVPVGRRAALRAAAARASTVADDARLGDRAQSAGVGDAVSATVDCDDSEMQAAAGPDRDGGGTNCGAAKRAGDDLAGEPAGSGDGGRGGRPGYVFCVQVGDRPQPLFRYVELPPDSGSNDRDGSDRDGSDRDGSDRDGSDRDGGGHIAESDSSKRSDGTSGSNADGSDDTSSGSSTGDSSTGDSTKRSDGGGDGSDDGGDNSGSSTDGAPKGKAIVVSETLACLDVARPPDGFDTPRVLDDDTYRGAFDAWEVARHDIVQNWNLMADKANLEPRVPAALRRAAELLRAHPPAGITQDDIDRTIDAICAPYPERIIRTFRAAMTGDDPTAQADRVLGVVRQHGLEPYAPPKPLPEITPDDVHLICWLALTDEAP